MRFTVSTIATGTTGLKFIVTDSVPISMLRLMMVQETCLKTERACFFLCQGTYTTFQQMDACALQLARVQLGAASYPPHARLSHELSSDIRCMYQLYSAFLLAGHHRECVGCNNQLQDPATIRIRQQSGSRVDRTVREIKYRSIVQQPFPVLKC
jgi:hypothetical protein